MSCINVLISQLADRLDISVSKIKGIEVSTHSLYRGMNVTCSIVCTAGSDYYLYVTPDTVWLTDDEVQQFLIKSNVQWVIEGDFTDGITSVLDKLTNEDLITNETLLENGLVYIETLSNDICITNSTLIRDISVSISAELDNDSYLTNSHYLLNKLM